MTEDPNSDFLIAVRKLRDCLQGVDFLYQLKVDELDKLMGAMKKRRYPAGFTVIKQGDIGDAFYMIASGKVSVAVKGKQVKILQADEYFGESALVTEAPRNATVTTETETELYILYKKDFKNILMQNPSIAAAIKEHVAKIKMENH
ncbi:MAG TPA: cyclic nucleotide-binding domain-containing protein [bacterium]|jgi:CRP-like cAMP-binding protein|nr:cyclic nucleotide-binding domain-containing protein [bacterium]